ncbi:MAG: hypothetical protein AB1420_13360 [Bacillota bacterium]
MVFDSETNSILARDFKNSETKVLFTIPSDISKKHQVYDVKLSPDKNKIAVTIPNPMSLYVFSLEGETFYKGEGIADTVTRNNGTESIYLQWLNEHTVIFQDYRDIVKLDIETGMKEMLIKDAQEPVVCPDSSLMVVKRHIDRSNTYFLFDEIKKKEITLGTDLDNIYFINKNKLIYNEGDKIILFDTALSTKEMVGNGHIIGISPDGSKVYYVNDQYVVDRYYY